LNSGAVDAWSWWRDNPTGPCFSTPLVVLIDDVKCVDMARKVSKDREQNIDGEIATATCNEGYSDWREKECDDDEKNCIDHFDECLRVQSFQDQESNEFVEVIRLV